SIVPPDKDAKEALYPKETLISNEDLLKQIREGTDYLNQREFQKASQLLTQCLSQFQKLTPEQESLKATVYQALGYAELMQGKVLAAEKRLEQAREIHEKSPQVDEVALGMSLLYLGYLQVNLRRFETAETLLLKFIEIANRKLGERDPYTVFGLQ